MSAWVCSLPSKTFALIFLSLFLYPLFAQAQSPDLIIQSVSTTTGPVAPNAVFSLSNTVKNQGTGSAGSSVVAFHLSVDSVYGGADDITITQTRNVGTLAAGATSSANTNLTVPSTTPLGNYYVCAMADKNNTVAESNETNNTLCTSSTITVAAAELIMTQVTPNASTVNAGAQLSVTNATQNTSTTKCGTLKIAFRLSVNTVYGDGDDVTISTTRTVSSLNGGATSTATTNITIPTSTAIGVYYVCAKTDSQSQVVETNESNNTLCSTGTVTVVKPSITGLSPSSGSIGTPVTINGSGFGATQGTSTVKFNGTTATPTSWSTTSIAAPVPAGATSGPVTVTVAGVVSNGQTFTVTASGSVTYIYDELGRLIGVVDPAGESGIYNYDAVGNLLSITRQVASIISIIEFTPNSGTVGATVTIYGTGFSITPSQNTVTFNGISATVSSSTSTQIVTSVPSSATTGPIAVTTPGGSATSSMPFTVISSAPSISGFTPTAASVGTTITITGSNFDSILANNVVKFNITPSIVTAASAAFLSTPVPSGATSGRISLTTPSGSATSAADFFIPPPSYPTTKIDFSGRISINGSMPVTISTTGHIAMIVFDGTTGQQITLNLSNITLSGRISIFKPDGTTLVSSTLIDPAGSTFGPLSLSATGTYAILLEPTTTPNVIFTLAGSSTLGGFSGDGGPATSALLKWPSDVAMHGGNVYIADSFNGRIRKVDANGIITTIAGTGAYGFSGDGGPATSASFRTPYAVALDQAGNLYIADRDNHRIRKVDTSGIISTVAGNGTAGFSGDGGLATSAKLNTPWDVEVDGQGNLFISDTNNKRIRKVTAAGTITTVAGNGTAGFSGDGGLATSAGLNYPEGAAVDTQGNIFIADSSNYRIRKVDTSGIISTIAGNGTAGYSGDGGPATSAKFNSPHGVAVDTLGNIFIADNLNNRIRRVDTNGIINTVAGNGEGDSSGDGGLATQASLYSPEKVSVDNVRNLFIADYSNHKVRRVWGPSTGSVTLNLTSP